MFHQTNYVSSAAPQPSPARPTPSRPPLDLSSIPPSLQSAALEYDAFLNDLTWNSKVVINQLTTIAAENIPAADAISSVIEQRIFNAAPQMKLPYLYLMDSIVKNVGRRYLSRFAENLFHTFTNAYAIAPPTVRMSLRRMLSTWPDIYGFELVNAMTTRADQSDNTPYAPMRAPPPPAVRVPSQQPQSYYAPQQPRMHMPPHHAPENRAQPTLRSQPARPPTTAAAQLPQAAARGLPIRTGLRSNPTQPAVMPQPPQEFVELETKMSQVIRNASMGTLPSNHQLFTLNRMITTQLQSSTTHLQRSALMRYQQQLREISSAPRHRATPAPVTPHVSAPSSAPPSTSQVPVPHVSATLTNLLRAMPPGLLQSVGQPSRPLPSANAGNLPSPAPMPRPSGVPRRLPDAVAPLYSAPSSSNVLTFADLKGMSHHAGVRSLYIDLPFLSKSDGMRFATKEALREHLDWLFRQNRRKRGTKEQVVVGGLSRGWFDTMDAFLGKVDPNAKPTNPSVNKKTVADENDDRTVSVVESKSDNDICAACHEAFETFWDDDRHAWMLRDCTKTDDDELYHVKCMQYAVLADDESADVSARPHPEDENSKPENESPDTALIGTNDKPLENPTNTNSDTPREPSTMATETAALTPTVKEEPQRAVHSPYNQRMVSQMGIPKAEPNMISVHSQGLGHLHTAAHVMPPKQEPLLPMQGNIMNNRSIPMQGLNMVSQGNMTVPDMKGKVIISKVPKWLAATTGIQVMALEPTRKEEPRATSTSPPSGQKRKRSEVESGRLDLGLGNVSVNSSTVTAPSLPADGEAVEPQSKRQKECNPET